MDNNLREQLAALEHEQWAHWSDYMLKVLHPILAMIPPASSRTLEHPTGKFTSEQQAALESLQRWYKQIQTPYDKLTEKEQDSDREWADKVIALILDHQGPDHG